MTQISSRQIRSRIKYLEIEVENDYVLFVAGFGSQVNLNISD